MPALDAETTGPAACEASLLIPARGAAHSLAETVQHAHDFLARAFPDDFEIILVPNPSPFPKAGSAPDRSIEVSEELAARFPRVRVRPHRLPQGKGAALRTGFQAARGQWIFFTDADLPYDLGFFETATQSLRSGFDLVTGNRRLGTSVFDVPVGLLPLAYRRHRLGLAFNRFVRALLPIRTTDTQAGIKAMSRKLAEAAFARQACPGFFFDLEFFLTAASSGYRHVELPVKLTLNTEKSTVRVLREALLAAFWLSRITLRNRFKRAYGPRHAPPSEPTGESAMPNTQARTVPQPRRLASFTRRYRRAPLGTRAFIEARWRLTPYETMAEKLPPQGLVLDLGCGHGLFSLALALGSAGRQVIGLDHDEERVSLAEAAAEGVGNLRYSRGTLSDPAQTGAGLAPGSVAGISMIDVMHYFPRAEQERLFAQAYALLAPGGVLIVREVEPNAGASSGFNRLYEKIATSTGFTRSEKKAELHFRAREGADGWEEALRKAGFEVASERCSHFLFADILYVCRK